MAYDPKHGHIGGGQFWTNGTTELYRHCDKVFELRHNGEQVMPIGPFEVVNRYLWLEFDVMGCDMSP